MTYDRSSGELADGALLKQPERAPAHFLGMDLPDQPISEADRALIVSNLCPDCGLYKFASEELCPACAEASLLAWAGNRSEPKPPAAPAFLAWFMLALLIAVGSGVVVTVIMAVRHAVAQAVAP